MNAAGPVRPVLPIQTVTGFLGAGKTTLIHRLLNERARGLRVAVVVNEFGSVPFDGAVLRGGGGGDGVAATPAEGGCAIYDLPGGCLCCTQAGALRDTLRLLAMQAGGAAREQAARGRMAAEPAASSIDRILIEASGAATGGLIAELLALCDDDLPVRCELAPTLAVVDAARVLDRLTWDLYVLKQQIRMADVVVLNRAGELSAERRAAVSQALLELNPAAPLIDDPPPGAAWDVLCQARFPSLHRWEAGVGEAAETPAHTHPHAHADAPSKDHANQHAELHAELNAVELVVPAGLVAEQLVTWLETQARDVAGPAGCLLRAKLFLQQRHGSTLALELAAGRVFTRDLPAVPAEFCGRLVLIGKNLVAELLETRLHHAGKPEPR